MAKKLHTLTVKGKTQTWCFEVMADPKHANEWWADGLEVYEVHSIIPEWAVRFGLTRPWCFFQDVFNLRNPFAK